MKKQTVILFLCFTEARKVFKVTWGLPLVLSDKNEFSEATMENYPKLGYVYKIKTHRESPFLIEVRPCLLFTSSTKIDVWAKIKNIFINGKLSIGQEISVASTLLENMEIETVSAEEMKKYEEVKKVFK